MQDSESDYRAQRKEEVETVKRRLKRRDAWHHNYFDDLVESTIRIMANKLANTGPRAQCEFLIDHGWSVNEIVKHGKRVRRLIRAHVEGLAPHKHKHKRRHK